MPELRIRAFFKGTLERLRISIRKHRNKLAICFLIVMSLGFLWAISVDYERRTINKMLGFVPPVPYDHIYSLRLTSIDLENLRLKASLTFTGGDDLTSYGPLGYVDLTGDVIAGWGIAYRIDSFKREHSDNAIFTTRAPKPLDIELFAAGDPRIYPFDKYLVVGAFWCPLLGEQIEGEIWKAGKKVEYLERLLIENSLSSGLVIRHADEGDIKKIQSRWKTLTDDSIPKVEEMNYTGDRCALIMERPLYLRLMTVVLGATALFGAFLIGFKTPFQYLANHTFAYIVALWAIRSIVLGDIKVFASYLEYVVLFLYLVMLMGIIFRTIKGR